MTKEVPSFLGVKETCVEKQASGPSAWRAKQSIRARVLAASEKASAQTEVTNLTKNKAKTSTTTSTRGRLMPLLVLLFAVVAGFNGMLDVTILLFLGLVLGLFLGYAKVKPVFGIVIVALIGAITGYLVVYNLPQNMQSLNGLLELQPSQHLSLIYKVAGLSGLAQFAHIFAYYSVGIGVVYTLLSYGLTLLAFKRTKGKRKR